MIGLFLLQDSYAKLGVMIIFFAIAIYSFSASINHVFLNEDD